MMAVQEKEVRIANSLSTLGLAYNAISTNPIANAQVGTHALRAVFGPAGDSYLREQLRDVDAQRFMEYLVGCALDEGQSVTWVDPLTETVRQWEGDIGLCSEWADAAPSEACRRRVSACIVARSNALGKRVELSMRGEDWTVPGRFAMEAETRPTEYDPDTAARVASFEACAQPQTSLRGCGWKVDAIGQCQPGEVVRLGAGGRAPDACGGAVLGSASGRVMLRVCEGIAGCDAGGARYLEQSEGTCGAPLPAVTFTCPASGFFNVMQAPWDSGAPATGLVEVEAGTSASATYRLSEARAFPFREGAYYGTLFDPSLLTATVEVVDGVVRGKQRQVAGAVYRGMFTCYDATWQSGTAYAASRVCAQPEARVDCVATVTGPCHSLCARQDGFLRPGDGDFEQCRHEQLKFNPYAMVWMEPVTVFLNAACDNASPGSPLCTYDIEVTEAPGLE
jgi:hypothetical protein